MLRIVQYAYRRIHSRFSFQLVALISLHICSPHFQRFWFWASIKQRSSPLYGEIYVSMRPGHRKLEGWYS